MQRHFVAGKLDSANGALAWPWTNSVHAKQLENRPGMEDELVHAGEKRAVLPPVSVVENHRVFLARRQRYVLARKDYDFLSLDSTDDGSPNLIEQLERGKVCRWRGAGSYPLTPLSLWSILPSVSGAEGPRPSRCNLLVFL